MKGLHISIYSNFVTKHIILYSRVHRHAPYMNCMTVITYRGEGPDDNDIDNCNYNPEHPFSCNGCSMKHCLKSFATTTSSIEGMCSKKNSG